MLLSTLHCATIFSRLGAPLPTAAVVGVERVAALVEAAGVAPSVAAAAAAPRGEAGLALGGVAAPHKVRF